MPITLYTFAPITSESGFAYRARACGRKREDGMWDGWIEFESPERNTVLRSARETTQPNLTDLEYWATGLSQVYLEGALKRTLEATPLRFTPVSLPPPVYDEPAPARRPASYSMEPAAILNPYSVYAVSPELLMQQLRALRAWHLRHIVKTYGLAGGHMKNLEALAESELAELIVRRVAKEFRKAS